MIEAAGLLCLFLLLLYLTFKNKQDCCPECIISGLLKGSANK